MPGNYRGVAPSMQVSPDMSKSTAGQQASPQPVAHSISDEKWWEVFQDKQLQYLIRTALQNNYDVQIAAAPILKAQAQLAITRADQLPSVGVGATALNYDVPRNKFSGPNTASDVNAVTANFNWQLDFWGKYRRATEASRSSATWQRRTSSSGRSTCNWRSHAGHCRPAKSR